MPNNINETIQVRVYAKVNLSLRILGRLEGGYHSLETIFQNISLSNRLTITVTSGPVRVLCDDPVIPVDATNTAYRAARICLKRLDIHDRGVEIKIEKGIPSRTGLGGASTDAAGTIAACEKLFGELPGGDSTRYALAASIGADVPFQLCGGRALAWGIGERMLRLPVKKKTPVVLVVPRIPVSTAWAYRALDNAQAEGINTETLELNGGPLDWEELIGPLGPVEGLVNDFEPVVFAHHPELREIKREILDSGARAALLCGSGSGIYGLYGSVADRDRALELMGKKKDHYRVAGADFIDHSYEFLEE